VTLGTIQTPTLTGGVSQQPDALRFDNQGRTVENAWLSPVDGLVKRWGSDHVAKILDGTLAQGNLHVHTINRDARERYVSVVTHNKVRVYGLDGTEYGVYAPGGGAPDYGYIDFSNPDNQLTDQEDFDAATWTPSADAIAPTFGNTQDPWKSRDAAILRNDNPISAEGFYTASAGSVEAENVWQVFSCYVREPVVESSGTARLRVEGGTTGSYAQVNFTFSTESAALVSSGGTATVGYTDEGDGWYRIWVAVQSGNGSGGSLDGAGAPESRLCRIYTGSATVSEGVTAFGALLEVNRQTPGAYIGTGDPMKSLTVADYTFLLNTEKTAALTANTSPTESGATNAQYGESFFFIRAAQPCCMYNLRVHNGDTPSQHDCRSHTKGTRLPDGGVDPTTCGGTEVDNAAIAEVLTEGKYGIVPDPSWGVSGGGAAQGLDNITAKRMDFDNGGTTSYLDRLNNGPVVWFTADNATDAPTRVEAWSSSGTDNIIAVRGQRGKEDGSGVASITDLPIWGMQDFLVKVYGDAELSEDNYYVKFVGDDETVTDELQQGHWEETVCPGLTYELDAATMPHQLIRKQDDASGTVTGTPYTLYFEFGPTSWDDRTVGDDDTNPDPSFVGRKITDLFFHSNRLGFLADGSVILSEVGSYFNFWRTSTTEGLVDSDPIDIAASTKDVVKLKHAVTFEDTLLLFSDRTQFLCTGDPALTPKTAEITPVFNYETYSSAPPSAVGRGTLMPYKKGAFSGLREILRVGDEQFQDIDTTAQVPAYISGDALSITGTSLEDTAFVLADGDKSQLYVYKWLWSGQDKAQSAWHRWTFTGAEILDIGFIESDLYMVTRRSDALYLEKIRVSTQVTSNGFSWDPRLDRRCTDEDCTNLSYSAGTDTTQFYLPFGLDNITTTNEAGKEQLVAIDRDTGLPIAISAWSVVNDEVNLEGDQSSANVLFGTEYAFEFEFSEIGPRVEAQGASLLRRGRTTIASGLLDLVDTSYLEVEVTPKGGSTESHTFSGLLGEEELVLGQVNLWNHDFRFPVASLSDKVTIKLKSSSYLPLQVMSAEWEIDFASQSTQATG